MKKFLSFLLVAFFLALLILLYLSLEDKTTFENKTPVAESISPATTENNINTNINYVQIGNQKIKVDLAVTPFQHQLGLGGRTSLKENTGMLFVFDHASKYSFWMKGMKFNIDIIWLGEDDKVVYIAKNLSPETYPKIFTPESSARYVLEVPSGFSDKNNLKVGDSASFLE
ncbi:DUF192 domain-containing protein [Patescibacteria group bacterium]|nr:DUF192 domain-containing protein [Patescibacteria group bacterium]